MSQSENQKYIDTVLDLSKFAPQPPPDIYTRDEAGPDWERPPNQGPISIFRRAAPYDLNDYSGGFGVYMRDNNAQNPDNPHFQIHGINRSTVMFTDIIKGNKHSILLWMYSYYLQESYLGLDSGVRYLTQIANDDVEYSPKVLDIIRTTLDQLTDQSSENIINVIIQMSQKLEIYIPRKFILPDIPQLSKQNNRNITPLESFFFGNIYWLRYLRSEKPRLTLLLSGLSQIDLYFVTANPFERYPLRKLLSYYNDHDLYSKFGRIGNFFFPKTYSSKQTQLDGIAGMIFQPFGYFRVENWSRPIKITYHHSQIPLGKEEIQDMNLDILMNSNLYLPILRLAIQIESSWPMILDKEAWEPFLDFVYSNINILHDEYKKLRSVPFLNISEHTSVILPDDFKSLEQIYTTCLLCEQNRPEGDFSLCGHGTCMTCQTVLGTSRCPFCSEHFVAGNMNDEFVRVLQSQNRLLSNLQSRVQYILNRKRDRSFKFDWANGEIRLFTSY